MADRYWVGGTGSWSSANTANWSDTSGGAGGFSVPTAADNVFFDAGSDSGGTFVVTMANTPRVCNDITIGSLDFGMTLAGTSVGLTVSGSLSFPATKLTRTYTGATTFNATTTGKTVTTNGVTLQTITFDGIGGGWTLGSALNTATFSVTLTNGTFDTSTNNYSLTCQSFSSNNSNTRTINLNNSTVTLNGFWTLTNSTNATLNAGNSTINLTAGNPTLAGGGLTYYDVYFTSTAGTAPAITGANTFNNLTVTGRSTVGISIFTLSEDQTINGTFTLGSGTAAAYRTMVTSSIIGTQRTLTCAAISSVTDIDFRDINFSGAISLPVTGTRLGDCKGNSNITFDAAKTVYYRQTGSTSWGATGSGSWSATSGGAADATQFPLAQDTAVFPAATYPSSGSTVTVNASYNIGTIDMSLRTSNTMTLATSTNAPTIYGNWINGTGITISGTSTLTFAGRISQTFTSSGKTFGQSININSPNGSVQLQDSLTTANSLTLSAGTLDVTSYTLTTSSGFQSSFSAVRTIAFGTGNITCTGTGTVWNTATVTNLTTTGTQVVNVTSTGSTAINISAGALSEADSISFNFTGGTYALTFLSVGNNSARNIDFTGYAGTWNSTSGVNVFIYGDLKLSSGMTLTAGSGTWTFGATSGTKNITTNGKTIDRPIIFDGVGSTWQLQDALTVGTTRLVTLTNGTLDFNDFTFTTGQFSSNNSNVRAIDFGTGSLNCSGTSTVLELTTSTNLAVSGSKTVNFTSVGSTSLTVNSGNLSEVDALDFNFTGGTYTCQLAYGAAANYSVRNLNFTGFSGAWAGLNGTLLIYGNLTMSPTMTVGVSGKKVFSATSGTKTITSNGVSLNIVDFNGVGGTWQLQDNMGVAQAQGIDFVNGTLNLNGQTLTTLKAKTSTGTKNITFNGGTLAITDASIIAWYNLAPTGFTTTAGTGTGKISMTSASAKSFYGGGSTYNCVLEQAGAGTLTISGSNTFLDITNTVQPTTITFTSGTTQTFINGFSLSGTAGNLVTINQSSSGAVTLSKASGTVSVSYCSISYSNATGGATWEALTSNGNVNGGNNTGWIFVNYFGEGNFFNFF